MTIIVLLILSSEHIFENDYLCCVCVCVWRDLKWNRTEQTRCKIGFDHHTIQILYLNPIQSNQNKSNHCAVIHNACSLVSCEFQPFQSVTIHISSTAKQKCWWNFQTFQFKNSFSLNIAAVELIVNLLIVIEKSFVNVDKFILIVSFVSVYLQEIRYKNGKRLL